MHDQIWTRCAVRLGLDRVEGLAVRDGERIVAARGDQGYGSVRDLWLRTGMPVASLEKLARADAFASMGLNRREALWAVKGLIGTHGAETLPLFAAAGPPTDMAGDGSPDLPLMQPGEEVIHDYASLSLSLKGHPVQFLRPMLMARGTTRAANLAGIANDLVIEVAGLVLVRQRPGTASGVIFVTLEDETGVANIVVWPTLFKNDRLRKTLLSSRMLAVRGKVQSEKGIIHIIAQDMDDLTPQLLDLSHGRLVEGDVVPGVGDPAETGPLGDLDTTQEIALARRRAYAALPGGRNFH
jgi:DNA polymerase III alpha subunit